jgi:hypothetical protein
MEQGTAAVQRGATRVAAVSGCQRRLQNGEGQRALGGGRRRQGAGRLQREVSASYRCALRQAAGDSGEVSRRHSYSGKWMIKCQRK